MSDDRQSKPKVDAEGRTWIGIDPSIDPDELVDRTQVAQIMDMATSYSIEHWVAHDLAPKPVVVVPYPGARGRNKGDIMRWWRRSDVEAFAELRPELKRQNMIIGAQRRIEGLRERGIYAKPKPKPKRRAAKIVKKIRVSALPNAEHEEE